LIVCRLIRSRSWCWIRSRIWFWFRIWNRVRCDLFCKFRSERYLFAVCFISSGDTKGVIFCFIQCIQGNAAVCIISCCFGNGCSVLGGQCQSYITQPICIRSKLIHGKGSLIIFLLCNDFDIGGICPVTQCIREICQFGICLIQVQLFDDLLEHGDVAASVWMQAVR